MDSFITDLHLYDLWKPEIGQVPCQNCGKLVSVFVPFIEGILCGDCVMANSSSINNGNEFFYDPRRYYPLPW